LVAVTILASVFLRTAIGRWRVGIDAKGATEVAPCTNA